MSTNSAIEWTDATWNPVTGCTRASPGCDNCYAVRMSHRLAEMGQAKYRGLTVLNGKGKRHFNGVVRTHDEALTIPLGWRKPRTVFVNSTSDLFHRDVPFEFVDRVFAVMAMTPWHTYQVLTKRADVMAEYFAGMDARLLGVDDGDVTGTDIAHRLSAAAGTLLDGTWIWGEGERHRKRIEAFMTDCVGEFDGYDEDDPDRTFTPVRWPLPNVWLGTSVEDQPRADERIPHLLRCPAAVRFLSCEPLIEAVDIEGFLPFGVYAGVCHRCHRRSDKVTMWPNGAIVGLALCSECATRERHWVIVGGESGGGARPFVLGWGKDIVRQCAAAGVPVFVKQVGANATDREGVRYRTKDRKGGEPSEWPAELRVRQMPSVATVSEVARR